MRQLIGSVSKSIEPTIGNVYAKNDNKELNEKFSLYEFSVYFMTFLLFVVGGLLITPFVELYTQNVNDVNYSVPIFGVLIAISEAIYCLQEPYTRMTYIADKFKDIRVAAYMEAIINIILSIILVSQYGLIGVAIGTLLAMLFRLLFQVCYLKNHVLNRSLSKFIKKFLVFGLGAIVSIILCSFIKITKVSLFIWVRTAIIYTLICLCIFIINSYIFYKEEFNYFFNKFIKIKKQK